MLPSWLSDVDVIVGLTASSIALVAYVLLDPIERRREAVRERHRNLSEVVRSYQQLHHRAVGHRATLEDFSTELMRHRLRHNAGSEDEQDRTAEIEREAGKWVADASLIAGQVEALTLRTKDWRTQNFRTMWRIDRAEQLTAEARELAARVPYLFDHVERLVAERRAELREYRVRGDRATLSPDGDN